MFAITRLMLLEDFAKNQVHECMIEVPSRTLLSLLWCALYLCVNWSECIKRLISVHAKKQKQNKTNKNKTNKKTKKKKKKKKTKTTQFFCISHPWDLTWCKCCDVIWRHETWLAVMHMTWHDEHPTDRHVVGVDEVTARVVQTQLHAAVVIWNGHVVCVCMLTNVSLCAVSLLPSSLSVRLFLSLQ